MVSNEIMRTGAGVQHRQVHYSHVHQIGGTYPSARVGCLQQRRLYHESLSLNGPDEQIIGLVYVNQARTEGLTIGERHQHRRRRWRVSTQRRNGGGVFPVGGVRTQRGSGRAPNKEVSGLVRGNLAKNWSTHGRFCPEVPGHYISASGGGGGGFRPRGAQGQRGAAPGILIKRLLVWIKEIAPKLKYSQCNLFGGAEPMSSPLETASVAHFDSGAHGCNGASSGLQSDVAPAPLTCSAATACTRGCCADGNAGRKAGSATRSMRVCMRRRRGGARASAASGSTCGAASGAEARAASQACGTGSDLLLTLLCPEVHADAINTRDSGDRTSSLGGAQMWRGILAEILTNVSVLWPKGIGQEVPFVLSGRRMCERWERRWQRVRTWKCSRPAGHPGGGPKEGVSSLAEGNREKNGGHTPCLVPEVNVISSALGTAAAARSDLKAQTRRGELAGVLTKRIPVTPPGDCQPRGELIDCLTALFLSPRDTESAGKEGALRTLDLGASEALCADTRAQPGSPGKQSARNSAWPTSSTLKTGSSSCGGNDGAAASLGRQRPGRIVHRRQAERRRVIDGRLRARHRQEHLQLVRDIGVGVRRIELLLLVPQYVRPAHRPAHPQHALRLACQQHVGAARLLHSNGAPSGSNDDRLCACPRMNTGGSPHARSVLMSSSTDPDDEREPNVSELGARASPSSCCSSDEGAGEIVVADVAMEMGGRMRKGRSLSGWKTGAGSGSGVGVMVRQRICLKVALVGLVAAGAGRGTWYTLSALALRCMCCCGFVVVVWDVDGEVVGERQRRVRVRLRPRERRVWRRRARKAASAREGQARARWRRQASRSASGCASAFAGRAAAAAGGGPETRHLACIPNSLTPNFFSVDARQFGGRIGSQSRQWSRIRLDLDTDELKIICREFGLTPAPKSEVGRQKSLEACESQWCGSERARGEPVVDAGVNWHNLGARRYTRNQTPIVKVPMHSSNCNASPKIPTSVKVLSIALILMLEKIAKRKSVK
ncbi:hypothetical protein B0H17DRAFT_1144594 [Mycena rosella]|uniref:Uncharacterized protein n=1 Tax=Mycena rosella TaxID=1033263 RepID=A0AAD7CWG7_MYCRO|nr:hypothetical protein B0H17DRAFT_1144594 [Mycena rosella]